MSLAEKIYERSQCLPEDKAAEVLDFIGYLEMKLQREKRREWRKKLTTQEFIDRFAGALPDFPDIEDEGPLQERDPL